MSTGQFKLFYKDRDLDCPCEGVHYQVVTDGLAVLASGQTDALGETAEFHSLPGASQYRLQVRHRSGDWTAPEVYDERQYTPQMSLGPVADNDKAVKRLRIKPFFQVRFHIHPGLKPIPDARFTAHVLDDQGRKLMALDLSKNSVAGKTDAQGDTPIIYCASPLVFKFQLPGTAVSVTSKRLRPLVLGQDTDRYDLPLKTVRATTSPDPDHEVLVLAKNSLPILISPSDEG
jgi:hypothetical protein